MDMPAVEPLFHAAPRLLKPGGRLVFCQMHPCFNSVGTSLVVEESDQGGQLIRSRAVRVERYRQPFEAQGLAMIGQPVPHWYFHRPLAELLGQAFAASLVMDGIEEPIFPDEEISSDALSWSKFREIPPVLAVRLRLEK